jgi:hypothetical protein
MNASSGCPPDQAYPGVIFLAGRLPPPECATKIRHPIGRHAIGFAPRRASLAIAPSISSSLIFPSDARAVSE